MAGKETFGVESADADLFQGARYALTPYSRHHLDPPVARAFVDWLDRIGARVMILDSEVHDEIVTWTSHLPQLLRLALSNMSIRRMGAGLQKEGTALELRFLIMAGNLSS